MPIPKVARRRAPRQPSPYFSIPFLFMVVLFVASGCGAPGEPLPPSPAIPTAISDLAAQQAGDAVLLTFTMPKKSVRGESLKEVPTLEVLRGTLKADGTPDARSFRVVDTVPGAHKSLRQKNVGGFQRCLPALVRRAGADRVF